MTDPSSSSITGEVKTAAPVNAASPVVSSKVETAKPTAVVKKCGVNSYGVTNDCGFNAFKNMYFECYDGYGMKMGDDTSCKSGETWQEYAKQACANHCNNGKLTKPDQAIAKEATAATPAVVATPACYNNDLIQAYTATLNNLQKAQSDGNAQQVTELSKKITSIKQEISKNGDKCAQPVINVPMPVQDNVTNAKDQCSKLEKWKGYIELYDKSIKESDEQFKILTGFSKAEATVLITDIKNRYQDIKAKCEDSRTVKTVATASPILPSSGEEINTYYQAKMDKIVSGKNVDTQIKDVSALKSEVSGLVNNFIKNRKEVEATELKGLIKKIDVAPGQIKADNITVTTTDKKIFTDLGNQAVSIEPNQNQVTINDQNIKVETKENISITDNKMQVGDAEVKVAASSIADNLNITPQTVSLQSDNGQATYEMKLQEPRKLFGLFSVNLTKTITADAKDGKVLSEKLPWYSFLTTRAAK